MLGNKIRQSKDKLLAKGIREFFQTTEHAKYVTIESLILDSKKKQLSATLHLEGEEKAITVLLNNIRSIEETERCYIKADQLIVDRIWIQKLVVERLPALEFEIDSKIAKMIRLSGF
jgi:hypothetical protein